MLLPVDLHHGGGQIQRDIEIVQTLDDVALQTAGIGHDLRHGFDLRALQRHAAGHDEADVAGAEDDHALADQIALHVHHALGGARRPDAGGAGARDVQRASGPLTAAHGQHHRLRPDLLQAYGAAGDGEHTVRRDVQHHAVRPGGDAPLVYGVDIALGVLGAGQLLMEGVQAKARVDALVQDAAQLAAALQNEDIPQTRVVGGCGGGQSGGTAAHDGQLYSFHESTSLVRPASRRLSPPHLVSSVMGVPSSSWRSSSTRGVQKPP